MMNTITLNLVGGPPWGFRIAQEDNEPPFVSQVLPEGRAYNEGMRVGDYIDGINGEDCAFADQVHQKMRATKGVLRLRLKRLTNSTRPQLPILPRLKVTIDESCSTPDSSAPPTPSSSASTNRMLTAASKPPLSSYNGGMRGSAQEKKRFFEQAIARQVQQLPQPVRHEPPKKYYASSGPPSESGISDISGYDSVAGDFFSLNNAYDRQTPISSNNENVYDCWYNSTSSASLSAPPAPPPPPSSSATISANPIKKWQVHVDDTPTKPITTIKTSVSTGKASGEVEVPRPQSVAELRAQIATKLEVRNPSGQKASPLSATEVNATPPVIVHQPAQQHRGKLTPSVSLLSLDRIQNGLDALENGSNISPTASPMASTSYDRSHTPNSLNETTSDYSGGHSNNSTLRRQHSQLLSQPEVQHAVLLHPGYSDSQGRNGLQQSSSMHDIWSDNRNLQNYQNSDNFSLLLNNGQMPFNNQIPETTSSYEEAKQKYVRPISFYGNYNETATTYRDRSDTPTLINDLPTKIRMNAGTPLLHSRNENDAPILQSSHSSILQTSSNENKQNIDANTFEQKINLGNGELIAQTKIESPILKSPQFKDEERPLESAAASSSSTTLPQQQPQKSQSIEAASNRLAELIELAKKTFSDDTGRSINENNLWIKSDNHLKKEGQDKSSSNSPKSSYNLRRPHSVYELNKVDTMNNNGYSTLPARGKSATRSFRQSSITSNDPDDIANAEKSAWYRSIYKQLHQVEPERGKFFFVVALLQHFFVVSF
uniref:PDZ domain-containing protein n=1 Tax=Panagrolaimus sp. ES5 TaxID=591445 RepID=A0AC34F0T8_9BILA